MHLGLAGTGGLKVEDACKWECLHYGARVYDSEVGELNFNVSTVYDTCNYS